MNRITKPGIPKEASAERIKRSYRKTRQTLSPGPVPSRSMEQAEARERMRDINVPYSVLSNRPVGRATMKKLNGRACSQTYGGHALRPQVEPEHCSTLRQSDWALQGTLRKVRSVQPA